MAGIIITSPLYATFPEEERVALALQVILHVDTERYDHGVCSGRRGGVAMPVTPLERCDSQRNARAARERMESEAADLEIPTAVLKRAAEDRVFSSDHEAFALYDWALEQVRKRRQRLLKVGMRR